MSDPPAGDAAPGARAKKPARAPARRPRRKKAATPESVQVVVFTLAGDEYALPIDQVEEVIAYTPPRSIASSVDSVRGVINLRGTILPVCDLAARLGRSAGAGDAARIVVVDTGDGPAGLIVGTMREVLTIAAAQLGPVRVTNDPAVTAIAQIGERLVVLLDAPAARAGAGLERARRPG